MYVAVRFVAEGRTRPLHCALCVVDEVARARSPPAASEHGLEKMSVILGWGVLTFESSGLLSSKLAHWLLLFWAWVPFTTSKVHVYAYIVLQPDKVSLQTRRTGAITNAAY